MALKVLTYTSRADQDRRASGYKFTPVARPQVRLDQLAEGETTDKPSVHAAWEEAA